MIRKQIMVHLNRGLQARNATEFVFKASSFNSDICLMKGGREVAAKSIMGVMSLAVRQGEEIILSAKGKDNQKAIVTLERFLSKAE